MREPEIHSHITDGLPGNHPLAKVAVWCDNCHNLLNASNNECMRTWVETGKGNFCLSCFATMCEDGLLEDDYDLTVN